MSTTEIRFSDQAFLKNPWPALINKIESEPVFWSDELNAWIVTRHGDIKEIFKDNTHFSNARRAEQAFARFKASDVIQFPEATKTMTRVVNSLDGMEHLRIRTLMLQAFRPPIIKALTPWVQEVVDRSIDDMLSQPGTFDFMTTVAAVLPTRVVQRLLGIPEEHGQLLFEWTYAYTTAAGATARSLEKYLAFEDQSEKLHAILSPIIEQRRANPGDDLISHFVHAREGDDQLTHNEVISCCHAMIVAGVGTTAHALGLEMAEFIRRPDLAEIARNGGEEAMTLIAEMLRYPCGSVISQSRLVVEEYTCGDKTFQPGDVVWMMINAGNVDPEVFPNGCEIDPQRDNKQSLTFGPGLHFCIGHLLSRIEQVEFFDRALNRLDFELMMDESEIEFEPSILFRGQKSLMVRCSERAG